MTITLPSADDARAIAQVNVRAWRKAYQGLMPNALLAGLSVDKREASWRQWIGTPDSFTLVARDDAGQVCGYVAFARSRDPDHLPGTAEIVAIYVDPDHWYGGTGTRLLDRAAAEIAALGFVRTTLWVLEKNTSAIRFYAKHGFQPDARPPMTIDMGGCPLQELRYVRGHGA
jgi:ribosomal protein S18 acetylase RimI-like enzyme